MRFTTEVNGATLTVSLEDLIDTYFNSVYDTDIMWESEEVYHDDVTITGCDLRGPTENVTHIIENFGQETEE